MDLIDRYLAAIARRLPAAKAGDIVAEIRDDLLTRQEAREEALGRPLDKDEVSILIKEMGNPLLVASRFQQHQYLIGPDVFPFYLFVLRIVLLVTAAVAAGVAVLHVGLQDVAIGRALAQLAGGIIPSLLINAAIVTLIFAVLDRTGFPADHLRQWRPEQLPAVDEKRPGKWESAFEVAVGLLFISWWCGLIPFPAYYTDVQGLTFSPAPVWAALWWPILALLVARLVYNLVQRLRPRWTAVRAVLAVATAAGALTLIGLVYRAGHWLTAASSTMPPAKLAEIDRATNLGIRWAIVVVGVILTLQCLKELWRLWRARRIDAAIA